MMDRRRQDKLLHYLEIFETGTRKGNDNDIIADFVMSLAQSRLSGDSENILSGEGVKDNLKSFLGDMIDRMDAIGQESSHELDLNKEFAES
ncbi:MAG: hypothetical protein K2J42_00655, partial [Muribaculaceae bacterium]|nr:hypothetical protein [Muribaculaceae bacterium]